jgi:glutamate/tyrosine decarboxylase-like PLP-dependent enzyme
MVKPLNDVVLNQVLVRFEPPQGDPDEFVRAVVRNIQQEGTCWLSGTRWRGREAMRASIVNWSTTQDDIDRSAEAILRVAHDTAKRS